MKKFLKIMPKNWPIAVVGGAAISLISGYISEMAWLNLVASSAIASISTFAAIFLLS